MKELLNNHEHKLVIWNNDVIETAIINIKKLIQLESYISFNLFYFSREKNMYLL